VEGRNVELKWQGTDNPGCSGVYCYDVYMRKENENWKMIFSHFTDTIAIIELENETEYSFYTIATDSADNIENKSIIPDISWKTSIREESLFGKVLLNPNPANTTCTITLEVEQSGNVNAVLSDVLGINNLNIHNGYVGVGRFTQTFDIQYLPISMYYVNKYRQPI